MQICVYMCICVYICTMCVSIQACIYILYIHGYLYMHVDIKCVCLCVPVCTCMCTHVCLLNLYRVILLSTSNLCMLSRVCLTSVMSFEIQRECLMPGLLQTHSNHAAKLPFLLMNMLLGEHTGRVQNLSSISLIFSLSSGDLGCVFYPDTPQSFLHSFLSSFTSLASPQPSSVRGHVPTFSCSRSPF